MNFQFAETTQLFTSCGQSESCNGDWVTLICRHHNIEAKFKEHFIFNQRNPFWRMNGQVLPNDTYRKLLYTPHVSSIKVAVNITSKVMEINFSCHALLNDGGMEDSEIVTIHVLEAALPSNCI